MSNTPPSVFRQRFSRRRFLGTTLAGMGAALTAGLPRVSLADAKTVKLGMNIPMTGDYAPWGLPGLYGCEIIASTDQFPDGILGPEMMDRFRKQAERFETRIVSADVDRVDFSERPFGVWVGEDEYRAELMRMGAPRLFVGITAGNLDSMLNKLTAQKKVRSEDQYS